MKIQRGEALSGKKPDKEQLLIILHVNLFQTTNIHANGSELSQFLEDCIF